MDMNITDTLAAIKVLDDARHAYSNDNNGACDAITGILYRAARKLDTEARTYLTGSR